MPTVPLSKDNSVRTAPLSGTRVNTEAPLSAFGGGDALTRTTEAAQGLNKEVLDYAVKAKQSADDVRVQDADLQTSMAQADIQNKAKNMMGKDAIGAPDYATQEWQKRTDKIRDGLSNDQQKRAFNKMASVRYATLYGAVQEHVSTEGRKYDNELTDAYIKNAQNTAATNYQDAGPGGQVQQSLYIQQEALKKYADRNGIPDELLKEKILATHSATHSAVIDQMLANHQDQFATDYYQANKDAILPDDKLKVEKAIEQGTLLGEGQRQADTLFAKHSDNRNAAFEAVKNTIKDPELRKQTESQLETLFTRQSQAAHADNTKNFQLASQLVEQKQKPPGNLTSNLTSDQRNSLDKRYRQVVNGDQPTTDWPTYYNLKQMAVNDRNGFIRENLLEHRSQLSDTDFKDLTNLQVQVSKNDPAANTHLSGFRTTSQVVDDSLLSAGYNVKSKNKDDVKRVADFRRQVDEHIQVLQDQTQKKARSEDVQKIVDNLLITAVQKRSGIMGIFDREKKAFEVTYKDVPVNDSQAIQRELRKRGRVPTERSIVEYYVKGLEARKARNGY